MESDQSKSKTTALSGTQTAGTQKFPPNVHFMIHYYGAESIDQFETRLNECGFLEKGSFNIEHLQQLEMSLTETEKQSQDSPAKGREGQQFHADWKASFQWKIDAYEKGKSKKR